MLCFTGEGASGRAGTLHLMTTGLAEEILAYIILASMCENDGRGKSISACSSAFDHDSDGHSMHVMEVSLRCLVDLSEPTSSF